MISRASYGRTVVVLTNLSIMVIIEKTRQMKEVSFSLILNCHNLMSFFYSYAISQNHKIPQNYHCGGRASDLRSANIFKKVLHTLVQTALKTPPEEASSKVDR